MNSCGHTGNSTIVPAEPTVNLRGGNSSDTVLRHPGHSYSEDIECSWTRSLSPKRFFLEILPSEELVPAPEFMSMAQAVAGSLSRGIGG